MIVQIIAFSDGDFGAHGAGAGLGAAIAHCVAIFDGAFAGNRAGRVQQTLHQRGFAGQVGSNQRGAARSSSAGGGSLCKIVWHEHRLPVLLHCRRGTSRAQT